MVLCKNQTARESILEAILMYPKPSKWFCVKSNCQRIDPEGNPDVLQTLKMDLIPLLCTCFCLNDNLHGSNKTNAKENYFLTSSRATGKCWCLHIGTRRGIRRLLNSSRRVTRRWLLLLLLLLLSIIVPSCWLSRRFLHEARVTTTSIRKRGCLLIIRMDARVGRFSNHWSSKLRVITISKLWVTTRMGVETWILMSTIVEPISCVTTICWCWWWYTRSCNSRLVSFVTHSCERRAEPEIQQNSRTQILNSVLQILSLSLSPPKQRRETLASERAGRKCVSVGCVCACERPRRRWSDRGRRSAVTAKLRCRRNSFAEAEPCSVCNCFFTFYFLLFPPPVFSLTH